MPRSRTLFIAVILVLTIASASFGRASFAPEGWTWNEAAPLTGHGWTWDE